MLFYTKSMSFSWNFQFLLEQIVYVTGIWTISYKHSIFYTCDIFLSSDRARGRQKRGGGGSDPLAKSKESKKRRYPPPEVGDVSVQTEEAEHQANQPDGAHLHVAQRGQLGPVTTQHQESSESSNCTREKTYQELICTEINIFKIFFICFNCKTIYVNRSFFF